MKDTMRKIRLFIIKVFCKYPIIKNNRIQAGFLYWVAFGKRCDFKNPRTFNEFITVQKNDPKLEAYSQFTDKYEVRKYVEENSEAHLNRIYGVWTNSAAIDYSQLPESFVLKCTHGSGYNVLVKDKSKLDIKLTNKKINEWLAINYYTVGRELNYKKITPRIICEEFLEELDNQCPELKVFCFNGIPKFIQVNFWRSGVRYSNLYTNKWEYIPVRYGYDNDTSYNFTADKAKVLKIAMQLSAPFDFVRVDLYFIRGEVYFSELTFGPGSGLVPFEPPIFDIEFGKYFIED